MNREQKLLVAFHERHQALLNDGYRDLYSSTWGDFQYYKMHHANGNYISIIANFNNCRLVQRTNGIVVHDEEVC